MCSYILHTHLCNMPQSLYVYVYDNAMDVLYISTPAGDLWDVVRCDSKQQNAEQ